jgi:hypothetical protein
VGHSPATSTPVRSHMEGIRGLATTPGQRAIHVGTMSRVLVLFLAGSLLALCAVFEPVGNFLLGAEGGTDPSSTSSSPSILRLILAAVRTVRTIAPPAVLARCSSGLWRF